jgi:MFS family permease
VLAFRTPGPVRRFLLVSMQSSVGNAIGYVALLLLAYDRFRSPWAVSLVLLADFLPAIVLAPLFGALADRFSRRLLTVGADLLRSAAFVGLSFAGSFAAILALALVAGVGTALYHPAAKSALAGLAAPHGDTAMGALVTVWSASSVAGPAVAAVLLLALSPSELLLVDAATFLISAVVLSRLPLDREGTVPRAVAASDDVNLAIAAGSLVTTQDSDAPIGHGVRAGLRAARDVDGLSAVIGVGVAATLAFSLMNVAEPLLATDELNAGGAGFALLVCLYGVGSTLGTLRGQADLRFLIVSLAGGGVLLCASALAQSLAFAAVTFLATGLPSLSMSGEMLTIEESVTLRARTEQCQDVGDEHE